MPILTMNTFLSPSLLVLALLIMSYTCSPRRKEDKVLWREIFKDSEIDPNIPKDKYGFSAQKPTGADLDKDSQKFMLETANDINKPQYLKVEQILMDKTKDNMDAFRNRMKKTADIINSRNQGIKQGVTQASDVAQSLINAYKKDFNKVYVVAEERVRELLSPLITWFKSLAEETPTYNPTNNSTNNPTNATTKQQEEALAMIQLTIDKALIDFVA